MAKQARRSEKPGGQGRHPLGARVTVLALAAMALAGLRPAAASTVHGATVLTFPLVVNDGGRDTVIELTNIVNVQQYVQCFYVNGAPTNPALPPGPQNPPLCTEQKFNLLLTRQQPTVWVASQGRPVRSRDALTGRDPGPVPAVPPGFTGYLRCVTLDASGVPIATNALIGSASLRDTAGLDISRYAAVGQAGGDLNNFDSTLCLGSAASGPCAGAAEFDACAQNSQFEHFAVGNVDPLAGPGAVVDGDLVFVPCSHDHATNTPSTASVQLVATSDFEQILSSVFPVTCWARHPLSGDLIYSATTLGTDHVQTSISTSTLGAGVMVLGEERHQAGPVAASAAIDASSSGARTTADVIVLPGGF